MKLSSIEHVTHCKHVARVYSRAQPCEISTICKKMLHKIYAATSNGTPPKNRLKDKYLFFQIKYSKTSLTTTLIWRPLYELTLNFYSLVLSRLPFSSSFESLFHQTNVQDSAVIWAQAFQLPRTFQNSGKASGESNTFLRPPFLKNGPLKLQKGAHLTPIGQFLE